MKSVVLWKEDRMAVHRTHRTVYTAVNLALKVVDVSHLNARMVGGVVIPFCITDYIVSGTTTHHNQVQTTRLFVVLKMMANDCLRSVELSGGVEMRKLIGRATIIVWEMITVTTPSCDFENGGCQNEHCQCGWFGRFSAPPNHWACNQACPTMSDGTVRYT